ncbi:hypothetical protein Acr_15g0018910 [Actinidia rufa]|uniref:Uncharacterized protein n=1 Tax=Actinidia rufa TaxID=165716 RepID=A0A7J0FX68_9ERIC|nr:hypothetical protein Acr_15g0018910 [Actinidia rufa]
MLDDVMTLSGAPKERLNDVELKILLVKKVVANSAHGPDVSHKIRVPEPKSSGSIWSAKELENFLWNMGAVFPGIGPQLKLRRLGVKDLSSTLAAADGLLDYKLGNLSTLEFKENKSGEKNEKDSGSKFKPKANDSHSSYRLASALKPDGKDITVACLGKMADVQKQ